MWAFYLQRLIARTVKTVRECRSQPYGNTPPPSGGKSTLHHARQLELLLYFVLINVFNSFNSIIFCNICILLQYKKYLFFLVVPSSPQKGLTERMFLDAQAIRISTCRFSFKILNIYKNWMKINKSLPQNTQTSIDLSSLWPLTDSEQSLSLRNATNVRQYIQNLKVIDNQKKLTQLSRTIERWETTTRPFLTPALLHIGEKNVFQNFYATDGIHDHPMCGYVV